MLPREDKTRTHEFAGKLSTLIEKQGMLLNRMLKNARAQPTSKVPRYGKELLTLIEEMNTDLDRAKSRKKPQTTDRRGAPTTRSLDKQDTSHRSSGSRAANNGYSLGESSKAIVDIDVSVVPQYRAVNSKAAQKYAMSTQDQDQILGDLNSKDQQEEHNKSLYYYDSQGTLRKWEGDLNDPYDIAARLKLEQRGRTLMRPYPGYETKSVNVPAGQPRSKVNSQRAAPPKLPPLQKPMFMNTSMEQNLVEVRLPNGSAVLMSKREQMAYNLGLALVSGAPPRLDPFRSGGSHNTEKSQSIDHEMFKGMQTKSYQTSKISRNPTTHTQAYNKVDMAVQKGLTADSESYEQHNKPELVDKSLQVTLKQESNPHNDQKHFQITPPIVTIKRSVKSPKKFTKQREASKDSKEMLDFDQNSDVRTVGENKPLSASLEQLLLVPAVRKLIAPQRPSLVLPPLVPMTLKRTVQFETFYYLNTNRKLVGKPGDRTFVSNPFVDSMSKANPDDSVISGLGMTQGPSTPILGSRFGSPDANAKSNQEPKQAVPKSAPIEPQKIPSPGMIPPAISKPNAPAVIHVPHQLVPSPPLSCITLDTLTLRRIPRRHVVQPLGMSRTVKFEIARYQRLKKSQPTPPELQTRIVQAHDTVYITSTGKIGTAPARKPLSKQSTPQTSQTPSKTDPKPQTTDTKLQKSAQSVTDPSNYPKRDQQYANPKKASNPRTKKLLWRRFRVFAIAGCAYQVFTKQVGSIIASRFRESQEFYGEDSQRILEVVFV